MPLPIISSPPFARPMTTVRVITHLHVLLHCSGAGCWDPCGKPEQNNLSQKDKWQLQRNARHRWHSQCRIYGPRRAFLDTNLIVPRSWPSLQSSLIGCSSAGLCAGSLIVLGWEFINAWGRNSFCLRFSLIFSSSRSYNYASRLHCLVFTWMFSTQFVRRCQIINDSWVRYLSPGAKQLAWCHSLVTMP